MDRRESLTLGGVLAGVRDRWIFVLVGVALGMLGALASSGQFPQSFASTALVQVYAVERPPDMRTEQILAASEPLTVEAAEAMPGGADPESLRASTTVGNPQGAQILSFTTRSSDAAFAASGANAVAEAYLNQRQQRLAQVGVSEDVSVGSIVQQATIPTEATGVSRLALLAAGAALGLLLGVLAALGAERFDPRLRTPRRMQHLFYDEIFVSTSNSQEAVQLISVLARRVARDSARPRIAILGTDPELVKTLLPLFRTLPDPVTVGGSTSEAAPTTVNAASLGSAGMQIVAAADCDLCIVAAKAKDKRPDIEDLYDQASLITGRPCVGWFVRG